MADLRPRRSNAGRNIGKLVSEEIGKDDFYSTAYGGFEEESEDDQYETEDSEEDQVDSDFDVDESTWGPDDDADKELERESRKKKQWIKPFKPSTSSKHSVFSKPKKTRKRTSVPAYPSAEPTEQRSLRKSTQEISRGFRKRREEEARMKRRRASRRPKQDHKWTHEELLEEAKWTELDNLASLEAYARMEEEKKKVKDKKVVWTGPVVRYLSVTMPMVSEQDIGTGSGEEVDVLRQDEAEKSISSSDKLKGVLGQETDTLSTASADKEQPIPMETDNVPAVSSAVTQENKTAESATQENKTAAQENKTAESASSLDQTPSTQSVLPQNSKQSRNFLVITDTNNYPSQYFPTTKPMKPRRVYCPVTGLPAKYIDPLTRTPYATPFAFKIIRMRYVSEAEQKCEKRLLQLSSWLEEKKKRKKMECT